MNTDARRKAAAAHRARQLEAGYRQKAFRLDPATVERLARLAKLRGLSEAKLISALVAEADGAKAGPAKAPDPAKAAPVKPPATAKPTPVKAAPGHAVQIGPVQSPAGSRLKTGKR